MRITVLALLALSMVLAAVEPPPIAPLNASGKITVVDGTNGDIEMRVVDKDGKTLIETLVLKIDQKTKIVMNKKTITADGLKVGDIVKVSYLGGSDVSQGTALSIDERKQNKQGN